MGSLLFDLFYYYYLFCFFVLWMKQPLRSEMSTSLQSRGGGEPLMASMGDPVEELREAVEMLNDTVRERGRSQSHEQAVQELLSRVGR